MSLNSNVLLFLAAILAGYAVLRFAPASLAALIAMPFLKIVAVLVILIFAFVIIYIGLRTLLRGGWR
ncbi:hypothetical protein DYI25_16575 [Mesobacillus boroniphilus]|uniref:Uncharacterized protein n=1 Tax=Mesobacillus boroniphilus TaxID=308892 RepID=A0A944CQN8_9BACI|nr:hypothetical protein [Mesobacillus boroniphilus]MBS8266043.1 hypothetical protein [Mesobacillus boroniphilus]